MKGLKFNKLRSSELERKEDQVDAKRNKASAISRPGGQAS